jgi:hypothetical protein
MGFVVHIARPGRAAVGLCFGSESEASDFLAYVRAANASHPSIIGNSRLGVVRPDLNPDSPPLCAVDDRLSPGCTGAAKMLLDRAQRCNVARQRLPRHRCAILHSSPCGSSSPRQDCRIYTRTRPPSASGKSASRGERRRGFHSSPNRLATARFMGGSALIARKVSRESISDGRLSVIVWCIAFNELRTARKP